MSYKNLNKFEVVAELDTEEKRNTYLSMLYAKKLSDRDMMNIVDTVKLSTENHPRELLLSPEWQKGYKCCELRIEKTLHGLLASVLKNSNSTLTSSANLYVGQDLILQLCAHTFTSKEACDTLLKELEKIAQEFKSDSFSMYDPEIDPQVGEFINGGKEKLYNWKDNNLGKYS